MGYSNLNSSKQIKAAHLDENELQLLIKVMKMVREEVLEYQKKMTMERERRVVLKTASSIEFVILDNILRCEADGRYTKVIFMDDDFLFVSMHMKELESTLQSDKFIRCHNSHLINKNKVRRYNKTDGGYFEMVNGDQIPVARARKEYSMKRIENLTLTTN